MQAIVTTNCLICLLGRFSTLFLHSLQIKIIRHVVWWALKLLGIRLFSLLSCFFFCRSFSSFLRTSQRRHVSDRRLKSTKNQRERKKNTSKNVCCLPCQTRFPVAIETRVLWSALCRVRRLIWRGFHVSGCSGGSSNNSHVLSSSHAAHSNLALLSSASSRGPCSSSQPPTEEISEYTDAVATALHKKYDCDYCVVPRLHKALSQSLGKMFLNICEICSWPWTCS